MFSLSFSGSLVNTRTLGGREWGGEVREWGGEVREWREERGTTAVDEDECLLGWDWRAVQGTRKKKKRAEIVAACKSGHLQAALCVPIAWQHAALSLFFFSFFSPSPQRFKDRQQQQQQQPSLPRKYNACMSPFRPLGVSKWNLPQIRSLRGPLRHDARPFPSFQHRAEPGRAHTHTHIHTDTHTHIHTHTDTRKPSTDTLPPHTQTALEKARTKGC